MRTKVKVDMMLVFTDYDGSEFGATLDDDVIASRFRSITNVGKYVVVGAPDSAESAINLFGKLLPVETHTFELSQNRPSMETSGRVGVVQSRRRKLAETQRNPNKIRGKFI